MSHVQKGIQMGDQQPEFTPDLNDVVFGTELFKT